MPATADVMKKRKMAVLGSRSVGKSSLIIQFVEGRFVENYHPTIEATFNKTVKLRNDELEVEIIDTAGQDEFSILNPRYAVGVHGYVLVYSVSSKQSFEMVRIIHEKIVDYCGVKTIPCVIVGAKQDVRSRVVSLAEGQALARELGCEFVETSAKLNINIARVFELCLSEIQKTIAIAQPAADNGKCIIM